MPFLDLPARTITRRVGGLAQGVSPVRLVPLGFALAILAGTALLMVPAAREAGAIEGGAPWLVALFTAVSATCVTGLVTVDTGTYWSGFGEAVILGLIQIGGLGTLVVTTLLLMALGDRLSLSGRLRAGAEHRGVGPGGVERRVRTVLAFTLAVELGIAVLLIGWWRLAYGAPWAEAAWHGLFHSVSAFNNAGFGLHPDSLMRYSHDPVVLLALSAAVVLGGIGMPVVAELLRRHRGERVSLHTYLTVLGTLILLAGAALLTFLFERGGALAGMATPHAALNALIHSVMLRTAGFNAIDIAALSDAGVLMACFVMIVGGGSVGTAGGIKVTTVMVLLAVVAAELRGRPDSTIRSRHLPGAVQREALAVLVLAVAAVGLGTLAVLGLSGLPLRDVMFEASSAFATVGLSTGITAKLPPAAQGVIMALMFIGRVGPITLGAALALRNRPTNIRYAEERVIVG
ncbi:MAG: ATPase [Citromicrobium sp.]|nr:MAG: ATPase [Citromicrobium sp.]